MKKSTITLIAIIGIIALSFFWYTGTRNNFVTLKEDIDMQQGQIETALQRRLDLIPNLVETVKGYAAHEESVYTEIAEARSKLSGSIQKGDLDEINQSNQALDSALSRLLVVVEKYPDLKANEQFTALQDELAGTENRISVARQYYNEKVRSYNTAIQHFPGSIVASSMGYYPAPYFEAEETAKSAPKVDFSN